MNVEHDGIARRFEILHGMRQQVAGDTLGAVLRELAAEGFLQRQLPVCYGREIADALAAESVYHKARREVAQVATARQADQHMSSLPVHRHFAHADAILPLDHLRSGIAQRVPELYDVGIRRAPRIYQRLHFLLRHLCAHGFERANSAPVAAGQHCLLAFLPVLVVGMPLDDGLLRDMEHAAGRGLVDFTLATKLLQHPFFARQPCQHTRLDSREVRHDKTASIPGDECRADQFGEGARHGAEQKLQLCLVAAFDDVSGQGEIGQVVLGKVLGLHETARPAKGTRRAPELQQAMDPPVLADASCHGFVLLYAGPGQFQPQLQQLFHDPLRLGGFLLHDALGQALHGHIHIGEPCLELAHAAGIFQPGQRLRPLERLLRKRLIDRHRLFHQQPVHPHASVVDPLIQRIQFPLVLRKRMPEQRMVECALSLHVLSVIGFVGRPLLRRVLRQVARASAVGSGGLTGYGKVADQVFAFLHLFLRHVQSHRGLRQFARQRPVPRHDHRAAPLRWIEPAAKMLGKTHPLKRGVVGDFQDVRVLQRVQESIRQLFPAGQVDGHHRQVVKSVGQQQNLEVRRVAVAVHAALGEWGRGIRLNV